MLSPSTVIARTPLPAIAEIVRLTRDHWASRLSGYERERLVRLVRDSRGVPGTLSAADRHEFRRLKAQLDLGALARHLVASPTRRERDRARRGR